MSLSCPTPGTHRLCSLGSLTTRQPHALASTQNHPPCPREGRARIFALHPPTPPSPPVSRCQPPPDRGQRRGWDAPCGPHPYAPPASHHPSIRQWEPPGPDPTQFHRRKCPQAWAYPVPHPAGWLNFCLAEATPLCCSPPRHSCGRPRPEPHKQSCGQGSNQVPVAKATALHDSSGVAGTEEPDIPRVQARAWKVSALFLTHSRRFCPGASVPSPEFPKQTPPRPPTR